MYNLINIIQYRHWRFARKRELARLVQLVSIEVALESEQSVLLSVDCFHPALACESSAVVEEAIESKKRYDKKKHNKDNAQLIKNKIKIILQGFSIFTGIC